MKDVLALGHPGDSPLLQAGGVQFEQEQEERVHDGDRAEGLVCAQVRRLYTFFVVFLCICCLVRSYNHIQTGFCQLGEIHIRYEDVCLFIIFPPIQSKLIKAFHWRDN